MEIELLLTGSILGLMIGIVLGMLGGGGSILTVPALVYVVGQPPQVAVTASLVIVGTNSVMGAMFHRSQGTLKWEIALVFGGVGMVMAYLAAGLSSQFSPQALMIAFALLMLTVGVMLIARKPIEREATEHQRNWFVVIGSGAVVGVLTGILGVGGGFLIVPALVMLVGLPIQQAVGTSLVIIAMNSLAGVLGHINDDMSMDINLLLTFVFTGLAGTFIGTRLARLVPAEQLRQLFAVFIIVLAVALLADNLL